MREEKLRLFALLLQEHPLQCKEKAAYLKNYHEQSLRTAVAFVGLGSFEELA